MNWWRLVTRLQERLTRRPSPRVERGLLLAAAAVFLVGGVLAFLRLGLRPAEIRWLPVVLAGVVGVPLTALVNAVEFAISARVLGRRVAALDAFRVSVLGTAANLLPLPGAALVRTQRLRQHGSSYASAASSTVAVGLGWIGVSGLAAGIWLAFLRPAPALALLGVGGAATAGAAAVLWRQVPDAARRGRLMLALVAVEVSSVAVAAARIHLVLLGIGAPASVAAALVLALSGSLSAAAGVFPGGLGLRELIAAGLAPVVGLTPAAGFLASAANRVLGIVVHAPLAGLLMAGRRPDVPHDGEGG